MAAPSAWTKSASILGLVVFGTLSSLLGKVIYQLYGPDFKGVEKLFRKPLTTTVFMFIGMTLCLPIAWVANQSKTKRAVQKQPAPPEEGNEGNLPALQHQFDELQRPLMQDADTAVLDHPRDNLTSTPKNVQNLEEDDVETVKAKHVALLAVPTLFDMVATILMSVGLLYVTASVYQMLRGAEMLFSALFAVTILRRHLNRWNLAGIFCCMVGISLVGASSIMAGKGDVATGTSKEQVAIGMGLIVLSQAVQAAQVTVEDYVMGDVGFEPLEVVGYEGIFGTLFMVGILLPISYFLPGEEGAGIHEDSLESWHMIINSRPISLVLLANTLGLCLYNIAGMYVTGEIGAVGRTVLETMRTLFVWLLDLALFYSGVGKGKYGEPWDQYSWIQAVGFTILVAGTLIYSHGDDQHDQPMREAAKDHAGLAQKLQRGKRPLKATMTISSAAHTLIMRKHAEAAHRWFLAKQAVLFQVRVHHTEP